MNGYPILFTGEMVRAMLEGRKTMTRRVVKLPHQNPLGQWEPVRLGGPHHRTRSGVSVPEQGMITHTRTGDCIACPYGGPGDRLWVRETWRPISVSDGAWIGVHYRADDRCEDRPWVPDAKLGFTNPKWRPSILMPRWAGRLFPEITDVRAERLQAITEEDARSEGCGAEHNFGDGTARNAFGMLWDSLNAKRGHAWDSNDWVWVISFRLEPRP